MDTLYSVAWLALAVCAVILTGLYALGATNRHRDCSVSVTSTGRSGFSPPSTTVEIAGYSPEDAQRLTVRTLGLTGLDLATENEVLRRHAAAQADSRLAQDGVDG